MSETVERVARAIKGSLGKAMNAKPLLGDASSSDWYGDGTAGSINLEDVARAAIAAMREPTEAMVEAGWQNGMAGFGEGEECEPVWHAMIDKALE